MFPAAAGSEPVVVVPAAGELIPLSHLALDLPEPVEGWAAFLGRRAIVIRPDSLGRDAVTAPAARRLLDEKREHQLRVAKHLKLVEQEQIEQDQAFRASLPRALPVSAFAGDMSYGELVAAAELACVPKRRSLMEESLSGQSGQYHSYAEMDGE